MPVKINGSTSGSTTITAPASGGDETIELSTALAAKLDTPGAWTAYTPTLTGWSLGNGTINAYYCQIGKIVHYRIIITAGSTTTFGAMEYQYPVTAASVTNLAHHNILFYDNSAAQRYKGAWWSSTTGYGAVYSIGTNGAMASISTTAPFTWGSSDQIRIAGTYEAA